MTKNVRAIAAVVVAVTLGLVVSVSPAYAGTGVSVGHSEINANLAPEIPPCAETLGRPKIVLTNTGIIDVVDQSSQAASEYAGIWEAEFILEHFAFNPAGTYESRSGCEGVPTEVAVTSWTAEDSALDVNPLLNLECSGGEGTYIRVTNAYVIEVTGTCTVTNLVPGAPNPVVTGPVTIEFTGNQNPCLGDFMVPNCDPPLQDTEFEGGYTQLPV